MRVHKLWIEIVVFATAIACLIALLMATLGAAAGTAEARSGVRSEPQEASPASAEQTYEGMVTCSRCGAKHSAALAQAATTCVRVCVHGGANFALVSPNSTYILDGDIKDLKKLAGQRARVVGSFNGKAIEVVSAVADE